MTLDELLAQADIVTMHVPLDASTRGLIDARALARMKPDAFLINTARGGIVDEAALKQALVDAPCAAPRSTSSRSSRRSTASCCCCPTFSVRRTSAAAPGKRCSRWDALQLLVWMGVPAPSTLVKTLTLPKMLRY